MKPRVFTIILDGLGVGDLPDAGEFGDSGCNTLANMAEAVGGISLPVLEGLGLGAIQEFRGSDPSRPVRGCFGRMLERSRGKDSTTGHWELAGLIQEQPFPLFPEGFPRELLDRLTELSGYTFIGNIPASGTEIIQRLGAEHLTTGKLIVYTSADSVFQVAAHEDVLPLQRLYDFCQLTRDHLQGEYGVSRVIARPFTGGQGDFQRSVHRRDYSLDPPAPTLLDRLLEGGIDVVGVGKVVDLFAGRGFSSHHVSKGNEQGMQVIGELALSAPPGSFNFINLVDFDMLWGHRRDPAGYAGGLGRFDSWLGKFITTLKSTDRLFITADHGNDPTAQGSDHTREYVPILAWRPGLVGGVDLGTRSSFADLAATVLQLFDLPASGVGDPFTTQLEGE